MATKEKRLSDRPRGWHDTCNVSGMKRKTRSNMETRDLKEMAWDEYGQEAYQAEMRLRFMMDTWPEEDGGGQDGVESGNNTEKEVGL